MKDAIIFGADVLYSEAKDGPSIAAVSIFEYYSYVS